MATQNGLSLGERHACGKSKREVYGWSPAKDEGEFMTLDKNLLRVDKSYQRTMSKVKVDAIARGFSWAAFGVILVAWREGSYWVYDGQHRVYGARKRDDIQYLPCMVFQFNDLSDEAQAFVLANTARGAVSALDKFKARIQANDADALAIVGIAERFGFTIPYDNPRTGKGYIAGIAALEKIYRRGADHCRRVLGVASEVFAGESPNSNLLCAFSQLDLHMQRKHGDSIERRDVKDKLLSIGSTTLQRRMTGFAEALGRSGEKVWAAGIVQELNKGKRTKRVEPMFMD